MVLYLIHPFNREHVQKNVAAWRAFYDDKAPHEAELPQPWETKLNDFQKMIVLRCIRPDKVCSSVLEYGKINADKGAVERKIAVIQGQYDKVASDH